WRDSGAGYAGGRFAMDVNVVFVPNALQAIASAVEFLQSNGYTATQLEKLFGNFPSESRAAFSQYLKNPPSLQKAISAWRKSIQFFWVRMNRAEYMADIEAKLKSLPENEQAYWKSVLANDKNLP